MLFFGGGGEGGGGGFPGGGGGGDGRGLLGSSEKIQIGVKNGFNDGFSFIYVADMCVCMCYYTVLRVFFISSLN